MKVLNRQAMEISISARLLIEIVLPWTVRLYAAPWSSARSVCLMNCLDEWTLLPERLFLTPGSRDGGDATSGLWQGVFGPQRGPLRREAAFLKRKRGPANGCRDHLGSTRIKIGAELSLVAEGPTRRRLMSLPRVERKLTSRKRIAN